MTMMRWTSEIGSTRRARQSRLPLALGAALLLFGLGGLAPSSAEAATATRVSDFRYNSTTGILDRERVEPDSTSLRLTTVYTFDAFGNKLTATVSGPGIASRTTTTAYDVKGRFTVTNTNALGHSETVVSDPAFGNVLNQTGPNGLTTTWQYDSLGRKILETRADGTKTSLAYTYCSGVAGGSATCPTHGAYVVTVTPLKADGVTANGPVSKTYFDGMGRELASDTEGFDGSAIRTATEYDSFGRVARTSRPYFLAGGTPRWGVTTYDALGRPLTVTAPDGSEMSFAYHGLTTSTTNDLGQTETKVNNAQGLLASVTDANGKVTSYTYDPFGNLLTTTDPAGNVMSNTYDVRGRKIAMSDPDMGAWTYSYDVLDQLVSQTDAKSQTTTVAYDLLGRMTSRTEPGLTSTWVYDTAANGIGKLAEAATDAGFARTHYYDSLGRPTQASTTILGDTSSISTYYDADGRVSQIAYPTGFVLEYVYNARGYNTEVRDSVTNDLIWAATAYSAEMQLTQQSAGNGVVTTRSFDANTGFVETIKAGPASAVADFAYEFDTIGNLTERADAVESVAETFLYDNLNRLTEYAITGGAVKTAAYDDLGNIAFKSDVGTYSYNASGPSSVRPHAVAAIVPGGTGLLNTAYTYDANGNMTSGNGRTVTWTSFDKVASIARGTTTVAFDYDSEHTRIRQVTASRTTVYLNDPASGVSLEKTTGSGGAVTWNLYIRTAGGLVAQRIESLPSGGGVAAVAMRYYVSDHLGSIAVITDEIGAVVERLAYDAWGKRRFPSGADDPSGSITSQTTRGFTGHEMIDEVGLVNMNGRVYDPEIGRFMSADPHVQDPTNSQSLNRYSYVLNNPLSYTDPTGYFFDKLFDIVSGFVKMILNAPKLVLTTTAGQMVLKVVASIYGGPLGAAAAEALITGVNGGDAGDILKAAAIAYATATAFQQIGTATNGHFDPNTGLNAAEQTGSAYFGTTDHIVNVLGHAVIGCASSVASGGKCGPQALAAGMSGAVGPVLPKTMGNPIGIAVSGGIGGFASVLGGGKFANGFQTAAYGYLFNTVMKCIRNPNCADFSKWRDPDGYSAEQAGADSINSYVNNVVNDKLTEVSASTTFVYGDYLAGRISCSSQGTCYSGLGFGAGVFGGANVGGTTYTFFPTGNPNAPGMISVYDFSIGVGILGATLTYRSGVEGSDLQLNVSPAKAGIAVTGTAGYQY